MRHPLLVSSLACAVASCFSPVIERQCERDADCGAGWLCIANTCVPPQQSGGGNPDGGTGGGTSNGGGSAGGGGSALGGGSAGGGTAGGTGGGGGGFQLCAGQACAGCCLGNSVCIQPDVETDSECGLNGAACSPCAMGSTCKQGQCLGGTCNASNCPSGCCSGNGCVPLNSQSSLACGTGGAACVACGTNNACSNGACQPAACNSTTCPDGCCQANKCVKLSDQSGSACGVAGLQCQVCGPGQGCAMGLCTTGGCGPNTCMGCCFNGSCLRGTDPFACGFGGQACGSCGSQDQCLNGMCTGCGPQTCLGCCSNGFCQPGNIDSACGFSGNACKSCSTGLTCTLGTCSPVAHIAQIGDPCMSDVDCVSLGANSTCKLKTSTGNALYAGGYCTVRCGANGGCPMNSVCESVPSRGENDSICVLRCGMGSNPCRSPGYTCEAFPNNALGCWIFPLPAPLDGGVPPMPDAGVGLPVGSACSGNQCSPQTQFCIPDSQMGFSTGYVGGYCSNTCGSGQSCPAGTLCVAESLGPVTLTSCKSLCFNPGGGQGTCRAGYVCRTAPSGGMIGWCGPRCENQQSFCPNGGICNPMTGYCS